MSSGVSLSDVIYQGKALKQIAVTIENWSQKKVSCAPKKYFESLKHCLSFCKGYASSSIQLQYFEVFDIWSLLFKIHTIF